MYGVIPLIKRKQLLADLPPALHTDLEPGVPRGFDHRSLRPDLTGGLNPAFMDPSFVPDYLEWGPVPDSTDLSELEDYLPGGRKNRRKKKSKKAKKARKGRKTNAKRKVKKARKNVKKVKRVRKVKKVKKIRLVRRCRTKKGQFKHCKKACHKKTNPGKGRFKKCVKKTRKH
jgi:hypothetical protein